ncbi:nucleoside monophosphate kinase [Patescibacteria group bacterium]|nr:nucleoside monophosphate kinase [Patescibacteria group bacterium]
MNRTIQALVIFGGQGSGKGTQSTLLGEKLKAVHIGMGDVLRKLATENTDSGWQIKKTIEAGNLIPDEQATQIIRGQLEKIPKDQGFVIEGYPRTIQQSKDYQAMLEAFGRMKPKPTFVHLTVPEDELRSRLEKRQELENRNDDIEHLIERRMQIYQQQTKPVLDAVGDWADVIEVNGNQPIPDVTNQILERLDHVEA